MYETACERRRRAAARAASGGTEEGREEVREGRRSWRRWEKVCLDIRKNRGQWGSRSGGGGKGVKEREMGREGTREEMVERRDSSECF